LAGLGLTLFQIATAKNESGEAAGSSPLSIAMSPGQYQTGERLRNAMVALKSNATTVSNYYPLAGGAVLTASTRIPVLNMVASPVNSAIRSVTRQKWGL